MEKVEREWEKKKIERRFCRCSAEPYLLEKSDSHLIPAAQQNREVEL